MVISDYPMSTTLYETLDGSITVTRVGARCEHCYQLPKDRGCSVRQFTGPHSYIILCGFCLAEILVLSNTKEQELNR